MAADVLTMPDRLANGSHLAEKMARVMGQINRVPKNGFNKFFGYAYASESDITDAVRGLLAEQGVFIFSSVRNVTQTSETDAKGKPYTKTVVWIDFTFADGESGETRTVSWPGEGEDSGDKGIPKALTNATKYFLLKTFLIATGDDPEGDTKTDERPKGAKPPSAPPASPPAANPLTTIGFTAQDLRGISTWIGQGKLPKDWSTPQVTAFKDLSNALVEAHKAGVPISALHDTLSAQVAAGTWTIAAQEATLKLLTALKEAVPHA